MRVFFHLRVGFAQGRAQSAHVLERCAGGKTGSGPLARVGRLLPRPQHIGLTICRPLCWYSSSCQRKTVMTEKNATLHFATLAVHAGQDRPVPVVSM